MNIESEWEHCLSIWFPIGRVEDLPRNERRPRYSPSKETQLGRQFAKTHQHDYQFLIGRLVEGSDFERLCAFECLEYICWEFGVGHVPLDLLQLTTAIPELIKRELSADADAENFAGETVGQFFSYVFAWNDVE